MGSSGLKWLLFDSVFQEAGRTLGTSQLNHFDPKSFVQSWLTKGNTDFLLFRKQMDLLAVFIKIDGDLK